MGRDGVLTSPGGDHRCRARNRLTSLSTLADEVAAGTVQVDVDDLKKLAAAAGVYISEIDEQMRNVRDTVRVDSFGGLKAARALGQKFKDLTDGTPSEGLSLVQLYEKRIAIMQNIQTQFQKAIDNYPSADQANAEALGRSAGPL